MPFFLFLIVFFSIPAFAITNIQQAHQQHELGVQGDVRLSSLYKSGNTESSRYDLALKLVHGLPQSTNIYLYSRDYEKSGDSRSSNKQFLHARHIHNWRDNWQWELFAQLQTDQFTDLQVRSLAGGGLRYRFFDDSVKSLYAGFGAFYTWEEYDNDVEQEKDNYLRGNSYLSYRHQLSDNASVSNTLYLQPRYNRASDLYAYNELKLENRIVGELRMHMTLLHHYDSRPFAGHARTDSTLKVGVLFGF